MLCCSSILFPSWCCEERGLQRDRVWGQVSVYFLHKISLNSVGNAPCTELCWPELTQLSAQRVLDMSSLPSATPRHTQHCLLAALFLFVPRVVTAGLPMCPLTLQPLAPSQPLSRADSLHKADTKSNQTDFSQGDANNSRAVWAVAQGWLRGLRALEQLPGVTGSCQSPGSPSALCCPARPCQRDCKALLDSHSIPPLPFPPLPHRTKIYWQL